MTLLLEDRSVLTNWPLLRTPVEQHAHVASSVAGGSERGAGSFFSNDNARGYVVCMPLRGAKLHVVVR